MKPDRDSQHPRPKFGLAWASAVIAVLGVILSGAFFVKLRDERSSRQRLASINQSLTAENVRLAKELKEAQAERAKLVSDGSGQATSADQGSQQRAIARNRAKAAIAAAEAQSRAAANPELQKLRFEDVSATIPAHYLGLYASLGLTNEQIHQFESILKELFWPMSDIAASALLQKLSRRDPAYLRLLQEALNPAKEKMLSLLGPAGFRQFEEFERRTAVRPLAEELSGKLAFSTSPLTAAQLAELERVLLGNNKKSPVPLGGWMEATIYGANSPEGTAGWNDIDWEVALNALGRTLSDEQMNVLKALGRRAGVRAQATETLKNLQRGAGP